MLLLGFFRHIHDHLKRPFFTRACRNRQIQRPTGRCLVTDENSWLQAAGTDSFAHDVVTERSYFCLKLQSKLDQIFLNTGGIEFFGACIGGSNFVSLPPRPRYSLSPPLSQMAANKITGHSLGHWVHLWSLIPVLTQCWNYKNTFIYLTKYPNLCFEKFIRLIFYTVKFCSASVNSLRRLMPSMCTDKATFLSAHPEHWAFLFVQFVLLSSLQVTFSTPFLEKRRMIHNASQNCSRTACHVNQSLKIPPFGNGLCILETDREAKILFQFEFINKKRI